MGYRAFGSWCAMVLLVMACSFEPEDPRIENDGSGWQIGDDDTGVDAEGGGELDGGNQGAPDAQSPDNGGSETDVGPGPDPEEVGVDPEDVGEPELDAGEPDPDVGEPDVGEPDVGPGPTVCDGETVDLESNLRHCGECSNRCDSHFGVCNGGVCGCTEGLTACGNTNRCEDLSSDPSHCGACGNICEPGEACQGGECVCRPGLTRCGGECVDTTKHPDHCGGCDQGCGFGSCRLGQCETACWGSDYWGCLQAGSNGRACMSTQGQNTLYCAPTWGNPCGDVCAGNQGCRAGQGCRDIRVGRGCDSCPCDDCEETEQCFDNLVSMQGVYCVPW